MHPRNILPKHIQQKVREMPESSHGATRVVVTLNDGTTVRDVWIAWGKEVVKVGHHDHATFDASRVVDVIFDSS